ncbi:HD domain-containing protein [Methylobacterium sp. BTF04]|uniref:HD domain-containing protein n=1 Tax=Methylobacterium sp. BTF04 TaxID=2708300 RepID=UPI001FF0429D|nr:HD domain-containing protein [Methylobacterium sp. BTF04]
MPPSNSDAHQFAAQAHAGQRDKSGKPYIRHVNRVAGAVDRRARQARDVDGSKIDPNQVLQAAYLHDVLEDTPTSTEDLAEAGYTAATIKMVQLLSKPDEGVSYAERITALIPSGNLGAILVKLSDQRGQCQRRAPASAREQPHGPVCCRHSAFERCRGCSRIHRALSAPTSDGPPMRFRVFHIGRVPSAG